MGKKQSVEERFWSKVVVKGGTEECWVWTGSHRPNNYGYLDVYIGAHKYKKLQAHRLSWDIAHPELPAGDLDVCHHCDNTLCVNPDHLFLGTDLDNMKDKVEKGRHIHGERHLDAKLTDEIVLEARARYRTGTIGVRPLAKEYGVSRTTMRDMLKRNSWKHLP